MTGRPLGPTAVLLVALAQAARASAGTPDGQSAPQPAAQPQVDVSQLPVNLARIHRQLRQATVREERDGLNLRYIVDVYGQAPRIELFTKQDNLEYGAVPYGAPTHRDMLNIMTPQEHRAPAANFNNLFNWLSGRAKK
jgi:hypothetical protein